MTVYIDSLFMTNFFMDSVIFFISGIISAHRPSIMRILGVTSLSALYGSLMFFPELNFLYGVVLKIIVSSLLVFLAFGKIRYIKSLISFWLTCAAAGGIILALSLFTDFGRIMHTMTSNGIVYLNISPIISIIGSILLYILMELYRRMSIKNFSTSRIRLTLKVLYIGKEYTLTGLIDTGCELTEPLSGKPVIVADSTVFKDISVPLSEIAVKTAAGTARLKLILPDSIVCISDKYIINRKTPIALSEGSLCRDGLYNAVINPSALTPAQTKQEITEGSEVLV